MKQRILTIADQEPIAEGVFRMRLQGDCSAITVPGQFINIELPNFFLRRPISVCDREEDAVTILYKVVGHGTKELSALPVGTPLDVLTGLGNGFDLSAAGEAPLLLGGGIGTAPLYWLAKELRRQGKATEVVLGFRTADDEIYAEEFQSLGCHVTVVSDDGTVGRQGFVTDALPECYSYFYACGPEPMLRAVYRKTSTSGEFSLEARMGCGFGACMGCSIKTRDGNKRICKDGPVLQKEVLLWGD